MLGKKFKFSGPVRVDRTAGFKISTHNFGHKNHRPSNRDLHSVVHNNKAHCKINQLFELIEMIHEKMFSAFVAKDHHEIKSIKSLESKGQTLKCMISMPRPLSLWEWTRMAFPISSAYKSIVFSLVRLQYDFLNYGEEKKDKGTNGKRGMGEDKT